MWPLLRRDGLALQYAVATILYAWLMGTFQRLPRHWFGKLVHLSTYTGALFIHAADLWVGTVNRYPDLWVVGNVLLCFGAYIIAWGWTMHKLWCCTEQTMKPKTE